MLKYMILIILLLFILYFYLSNIEKFDIDKKNNFFKIKGFNSNNFNYIDLHPDNSDSYKLKIIKKKENFNLLKNKYKPPRILNSIPFQNIEINKKHHIIYEKIKKFIISKIKEVSNEDYKIISNKLFNVMQNKYCFKYNFNITINYKKPIFTYQINCKIITENNRFYIDQLNMYGSSIEYPISKFKKNNYNKQYYSTKKNSNSNFDLINRNNIPKILKNIVEKHSPIEYNGIFQGNCANFDSTKINLIPNKFWCNYNNKGKNRNFKELNYWDKPCRKNEDCPFYNKKKNSGNCIQGFCEMPPNVKRIRYTKYENKK